MKMILQKHTSKFVAGLFNSLGITACVALTSCGDENKGKQTENQGEELKNKLKTVDFYKSLAEDEGSLKTIADWLNSKNYGSDYILTAKDLQEIFQNDSSKLNDVAGKLGVELNESDNEFDDEEEKEINKWLTKLNSLENADFNRLDEGLKEKVAQKFIDDKIDITNDDVITSKLADFINEVKEKKKQNEISIKIEGKGKVIITKVAGNTKTDFVFGEIKNLQSFVENLKDKEITKVEGTWSLSFDKENVKICGHETGFKVTDCFGDFLNCFNTLVGVEKLKITKLSLKIEKGSLSLNDVACNDDYYNGSGFWSLVNKHADLFGITDENKFEIEKKGDKGSETVKINGFESSLKWSEVVESENTFKEDSGWKNIFKIKNEEPKTEVKIEWNVKDGYKLGDAMSFTKIDNLKILGDLVNDLKDKTVTEFKGDFTLKFNGTNVNICGGNNIDIQNSTNFETLLGYVENLRKTHKAINSEFKIDKIGVSGNNKVKFGESGLNADVWNNSTFWKAVKTYQDLFNGLPIAVEKNKDNNNGKIGKTVINVEMFSGEDIAQEWKEIFKKK